MEEQAVVNLDFLNDKDANKDFAESEEIQPGGVPAGVYVAEITKVDIQKSQNTGNPMVVWQLVVAQGPYTGKYLPAHRNMLPFDWYCEKCVGAQLPDATKKPQHICPICGDVLVPGDDMPTKKQKWGKLKGELTLCQIPVTSLSGFPKALEELTGKFVGVKVSPQRNNPEYSNVNIQKYVENLEEVEVDDAPVF